MGVLANVDMGALDDGEAHRTLQVVLYLLTIHLPISEQKKSVVKSKNLSVDQCSNGMYSVQFNVKYNVNNVKYLETFVVAPFWEQ